MAEQTNPYLALLQQEEKPASTAEILRMFANMIGGASSGIARTGTWGGVAPGLMMGIQANAQEAEQAEKRRMRQAEIGIHASKWDEERQQRLADQAAREAYGKNPLPGINMPGTTPGITAPQGSPVKLGPDLVSGGTPVVNYLTTKHGFTPLGAATVAGNLYQESGFNPGASGDSGTAFGMGQWRLDRQDKLRSFAATQQKPVTDPQVQLDYLVSEMKGGDTGAQRAYALLQNAKTPEEANAAMMHFFRPAGYTPANPAGGHGYQNRVQNTVALLPNGQPAPQGSPPVAPAPDTSRSPQYASLPPFVGPGMGEIQPGATGWPQLSAPPPPPPQVAQGDSVTPGGSQVDPNAPAPSWTGQAQPPTPGGPNVVQAQYSPQPGRPTMAPQSPPPQLRPLAPEIESRINGLVAMRAITIPQAEKMKQDAQQAQYQGDLKTWEVGQQRATEERKIQATIDSEMRKLNTDTLPMKDAATGRIRLATKAEILAGLQSGKLIPPEDSEEDRKQVELAMKQGADKRDAERLDLDRQKAAAARAQMKVNPDGTPNQPLIQAETQQAAAVKAAEEAAKLDTTAATALVTQAVKEFVDKERPKGLAVQETIPNIHNVRRLVNAGAITGTGTETRNYLAQLASTLGFKSSEAALTPAYLGAMADQIVANAKALGVNPTNRDNEIIAKAKGADPNVSKEGVLQLLDIQEQLQRRAHQRYIAEAKRVQGMRGVQQAYGDDYFILPEPPKYDEWLKDNPLPSQQGQPGAAAPGAPPPGGTFPAPTPAAIKALQMAPTKREEFDALFGPGAAAKALGR